jgi:flagellar hook assembly protein FlgD
VQVSYAFTIRDLYNIPNPTKGETYFTFMLFGQNNPSSCRIKIYTVAGRLIKQINAFARIGFNNIYWDGRDQDGDYMANGVYLYKLILEDGNNTQTSIQKLAILR